MQVNCAMVPFTVGDFIKVKADSTYYPEVRQVKYFQYNSHLEFLLDDDLDEKKKIIHLATSNKSLN